MRRDIAIRPLALLLCILVKPAAAQVPQPTFAGELAWQHTARLVLDSGRLLGVRGDSVSHVVVGETGAWFLDAHRAVASLHAPAGSSSAFGSAAAIIPNYRNSSFDAIAIGDPGANGSAGAVYIYFGSAQMDSTPGLVLNGEAAGDLFGASLAGLGDFDGDGFGDLAVGAPARSSGVGALYLFRGGAAPSNNAALTIAGAAPGELFGSAVVALSDIDGDGRTDYAAGAPGAASGLGVVRVFRTGTPLVVLNDPVASSAYGERPRFGSVLAAGLDLNGDGRGDLVVGAPGASMSQGAAYVYRGSGTSFDPTPTTLHGAAAGDRFGSALALGTFRAFPTVDLVVGAPGVDEGRGAATLFFGGPSFDAIPDGSVNGLNPDDQLGYSVGAAKLFAYAAGQQLLIGAPAADVLASGGGLAESYVTPPATSVEQVALLVQSDGETLGPGGYTTAEPLLEIELPGATSVDLSTADVRIDGVPQHVQSRASRNASGRAQPADGVSGSASIVVQAGGLTDGPHTLSAHLADAAHTRAGTADVHFVSAARLRIDEVRVSPNPARGVIRMTFVLTRPAQYELSLYDLAGRRTFSLQRSVGIPGANELRFGDSNRAGVASPGVYFYVLSARFLDQHVQTRGRLVVLR
jgi:hypothetical protein